MGLVPSSTASALLEIFVFLAVAEVLRLRLRRYDVPEILGDVLVGVLLAPVALGGIVNQLTGFPLFQVNAVLLAFADFSIILLIFAAGLEGGVSSLRKAGVPAILAAISGDLIPFGLTFAIFAPFYGSTPALLMGVAAGATSTAVVVSLIRSEGLGGSTGGGFLLATAALDDVVGLVLLSAILAVAGGNLNLVSVTGSVTASVIVWVGLLLTALLVVPRVFRIIGPRETYNLPLLILFVLAAVVTVVGFSTVVGAYIAGLAIAESLAATRTRQIVEALLLVFGSLFFVVVGFEFDFHTLLDPLVVLAALLLAIVAAGGKLVGIYPLAMLRFRRRAEATMIAVGMIPRGEIGLIVGAIGISTGLLTQGELGAILVMALVTTGLGSLLFHRTAVRARQEYLLAGRSPAQLTGQVG